MFFEFIFAVAVFMSGGPLLAADRLRSVQVVAPWQTALEDLLQRLDNLGTVDDLKSMRAVLRNYVCLGGVERRLDISLLPCLKGVIASKGDSVEGFFELINCSCIKRWGWGSIKLCFPFMLAALVGRKFPLARMTCAGQVDKWIDRWSKEFTPLSKHSRNTLVALKKAQKVLRNENISLALSAPRGPRAGAGGPRGGYGQSSIKRRRA